MIERVAPDRRLRICVLGDLDGVHTQGWLAYFVQRGHDVHGISYYVPARPPEGVRVHALRAAAGGGSPPGRAARPGLTVRIAQSLPIGIQRLVNLLRYRRAGLRRVVEEIAPDVLHAHYLVEHGLYGTAAGFRPYVLSAWGSDVLVEPQRSRLNRALARFALRRATLATANNRYMLREMVLKLGIERAYAQHVVLGVSREFLDGAPPSVNAQPPDAGRAPVVISTRSLDTSLYNIDVILRAMARVRERVANARLVVVGEGRLRPQLEALAQRLGLGDNVTFVGFVSQNALRQALAGAEVFVSVPSSDGTSVALLQAMGVGAFPIVSDLPSQQELVEDGVRGFRVPVRDDAALGEAILRALDDHALRSAAVERNRVFVEDYGVTETNMARMEAWYYRLAGRADEVGEA
jgi:glycosyltransferase involved in cell wall biosynthesis